MRVSPKKRAANRRNALKSTGPKTVSGRRASAQNATRHGLSVPLPTHLVEPVQQQLVQLIMLDGFDHDIANNLAEKIIEYERNVKYLHDFLTIKTISPNDPDDNEEAHNHLDKEEQEKLVNYLTDIKPLQTEDQKPLQFRDQIETRLKGMILAEEMFDNVVKSQRYFKRASNQLIKALRQL